MSPEQLTVLNILVSSVALLMAMMTGYLANFTTGATRILLEKCSSALMCLFFVSFMLVLMSMIVSWAMVH